jgi:hypothetical protein
MHSLTTLLQLFAAFVIFAAAYLALLISGVICCAIAICVRKVGRVAWAYTMKSAPLYRGELPRIEGHTANPAAVARWPAVNLDQK